MENRRQLYFNIDHDGRSQYIIVGFKIPLCEGKGRYSWFPVSKGLDLPLRGLTLPELLGEQAQRYGEKTFLRRNDQFDPKKETSGCGVSYECSVFREEKERLHEARVGKSHFSENVA